MELDHSRKKGKGLWLWIVIMTDWTVYPKITHNDLQETNNVTFQKQHFHHVLQT